MAQDVALDLKESAMMMDSPNYMVQSSNLCCKR